MIENSSEFWFELAMKKYKEIRREKDDPIEILTEEYKNVTKCAPVLGRDAHMLGLYISVKEKKEKIIQKILDLCREIDHLDKILDSTGLTINTTKVKTLETLKNIF